MRQSKYVAPALIFLACLLVVIAGYRHTNIKLLRAENGIFQRVAHESREKQAEFVRGFWTTQNNRHYIPIAFTQEFAFTRFAGMRPWLWRSRQIFALALVGTMTFLLARSVGRTWQMNSFAADSVAAGFTAILIFQPLMNEMIAWPFLFIHMIWITLVMFVLWSLVTLSNQPQEGRWVWYAAVGAYGSMHFLGLGVVVVAAMALIFLLLLMGIRRGALNEFRPIRPQLRAGLIFLAILGSAHAACMIFLPSSSGPPTDGKSIHASLAEVAALVTLYPLAIATSFGGVSSIVPVNREIFGDPWPFGIVIAILAVWIAIRLAHAAFNRPTPPALTAMVLHIFSTAAFFGWVAMIGLRQLSEADRLGDYGFLVGPRYLVPISFLASGIVLAATVLLCRRGRTRSAVFSIMIALAAFWTHYNYTKNVYLRTRTLTGVRHDLVWKEIVTMAEQSRAARLPIPNIPMAALTEGFHSLELNFFEPMLRAQLHLAPRENCDFIDWKQSRAQRRADYDTAVPSLVKVVQTLGLEDTPAAPNK